MVLNESVKNNLVSVVITTHNRPEYLKESLISIRSQTYTNIEILVVDDGSSPINASKNKSIVKAIGAGFYFYKENTGQPDSRNYGITRAKGEYIAFCDDDDLWSLDKLQRQVEVLMSYSDYDIVTGCIEYIKENGDLSGELKCHTGYNHGNVFKHFLVKNRTASITPLMRRSIFNKVGLFNPNFTIAEDWEFWRRVSYYFKFYSIDSVLAYVRLHNENMSNTKSGEVLEFFSLYRKLTKALMQWGENRFSKADISLIYEVEWLTYRKIMTNHYSGYLRKIKFMISVSLQNFNDGLHLMGLIFRFEIKNSLKL